MVVMLKTGVDLKRDCWADSVCGFLIHIMVLGHILQRCDLRSSYLYYCCSLFGFFMPWFFFKAGFYFREKKVFDEVKSGFVRLLKPYLLFSILGECVYLLIEGCKNGLTTDELFVVPIKEFFAFGAPAGNMPLWFLLTLFVARVLFQCLKKIRINDWTVVLVFYVLAIFFHYYSVDRPLLLGNLSMGMCCLVFGKIWRSVKKDNRLVIMCFVIYVFFVVIGCTNVGLRGNDFVNNRIYPFWLVFAATSIICINYLGERIGKLRWLTSYFGKIGRNSMDVYVWHWIFIVVSYYIFSLVTSNSWFLFLGIFSFTYLMSFVIVKSEITRIILFEKSK